MKKVLLIVAMLLNALLMNAQSDSLKVAYKQVVNTLKEYNFLSEDASGTYGKTKSISLIVQNGNFVFTFVDDFGNLIHHYRHGKKVIIVPVSEVMFRMNYYNLSIGGKDGIEFTYKGKKEILQTYCIKGTELTLKKLHKELTILQEILIQEGYKGSLGVAEKTKQSAKSKSAPQKEATTNQKQQKTRNRIPSGN